MERVLPLSFFSLQCFCPNGVFKRLSGRFCALKKRDPENPGPRFRSLELSDQVCHGIETGGVNAGQETRRLHRAGGKDLAAQRGVTQFDDLVPPGKKDLVIPHNTAAPYGGDPDLVGLTGPADALALIDVLRRIGKPIRRRFRASNFLL